jgi:hypothetical protein
MTALLIAVLSLGAGGWRPAASVQPRALGIYTFSRDSDHGLKDERLDTFRRELGKYASPLMELAYSRDSAQVTVQFLGQGDLAAELDTDGKAVRHLWTPDDEAPRMWAIVRIGSDRPFSKEFSVEGAGGRDISRLAKSIGDWLQQNSTVLREP